jgi:hypothetical protein
MCDLFGGVLDLPATELSFSLFLKARRADRRTCQPSPVGLGNQCDKDLERRRCGTLAVIVRLILPQRRQLFFAFARYGYHSPI